MSLLTFKSWEDTDYFVLFSEHFCFLFQLLVQIHKHFSPPFSISSFLQRGGNECDLQGAKALHRSLNGESNIPLQVTQDFTKVLRYISSPFSHQWWLMLGVNIFTESPPLTPACPLSHMMISLHWEILTGKKSGRFGAPLQWQYLPNGGKGQSELGHHSKRP